MKCYKLRMQIELVEVESFDPQPPPILGVETSDNPDPVERDREEIKGLSPVAMVRAMQGIIQPPRPAPPQSELTFRRTYDVPAQSLEAAAAKLVLFEETAESIGVPAKHFEGPGAQPFGFITPGRGF